MTYEWQPAETAPKTGEMFIAWDNRNGKLLFTMHWEEDEFRTLHEPWSGFFSHWLPRPTPPQE